MSTCPRCATQFSCAMADQTDEPCWCIKLPIEPVLPIYPELTTPQDPRCFCPLCLAEWNKSTSSVKGSAIKGIA